MSFRVTSLLRSTSWHRNLSNSGFFSTKPSNSENTGSASKGTSTVNVPSKDVVTKLPPLTESLTNLPEAIYATPTAEDTKTQVTTLANGLRIASEKRFGQFCTVGIVIDSGPRYEVAYPSGVSHFLEKLAFNVSTLYFLLSLKVLFPLFHFNSPQ